MGPRMGGLHGRRVEVAALEGLVDAATSGSPFVALVEGEAGIGKSRLHDAACERARAVGLRVVGGSAFELERQRPFGPLADALGLHPRADDPERARLGHILYGETRAAAPPLDADPAAPMYEVIDGIVELLQRMGDRGPVLLAIEDLHWADQATLTTLGRVARLRAHLSTSLLCTSRPTGDRPDLQALQRALDAAGTAHIALSDLDAGAVREIVEDHVGARAAPSLMDRVGGAAGNPLYVIELVSALQEEGLIRIGGGVAELHGTGLPPNLRLTILRRLGVHPRASLELVRVAAVLGASFSSAELAVATGRPVTALGADLEPLLEAGVLVADGETLRFRHDVIREATYADVPEPLRAAMHHDIGHALADAGMSPTRAAHHFERGLRQADARASDWLWRLAEQVLAVDPAAALAHADAAIERTPTDHPERSDRLVRRAVMALRALHPDGETHALELLGTDVTPAQSWALEIHLARAYAGAGRVVDLERIALADRGRPMAAQALLAMYLGAARTAVGDFDGVEPANRAVLELGVVDEAAQGALAAVLGLAELRPHEELGPLINTVMVSSLQGRTMEAVAGARRVLELLAETQPGVPQPAHVCPIQVFAEADRHDDWRAVVEEIQRGGTTHCYAEISTAIGHSSWVAGAWDEAAAELEASVSLADDTGSTWTKKWSCSLLAAIHLHRGDLHAAGAWLDVAEASDLGLWFTSEMWVRSLLLDAEGRADEALSLLASAFDLDHAIGWRSLHRYYAADLVGMAVRAGDAAVATRVLAAAEEQAELGAHDSARAVALRCRGLVDADATTLVAASDLYRDAGRPVAMAYAFEDAAMQFGAAGDTTQARELLERASAEYDNVGAAFDKNRAIERLRAVGVRPSRASRPPRPSFGWQSLSASELRVVELVAEGLTYGEIGARLFLSRRTVESHVSHSFVKLNVRSKAALAAEFARRRG